jgi:GT2 family glycosyltransferase
MLLSIIIVNWNTRQLLLSCLASIVANPPTSSFEILVFDNASSDGSVESIASEYPEVHLMASSVNLGFARANNRAAASAQGQFLLLLNPDTVVGPGTIDTLLRYLANQPQVAAVGPRLVQLDGTIQHSIERLPTLYREWWRLLHLDHLYPVSTYPRQAFTSRQPRRVEVIAGACFLLRQEAVATTGLFDEEYFIYSEEIDLCDRLQERGWELHWVPEAVVSHLGGQSTRQVADRMFVELYRSKVKFFRKRRGRLSAWLYKVVLLQAGLVRYGLGKLMTVLPLRRRNEWIEAGRQYGLLLGELPSL